MYIYNSFLNRRKVCLIGCLASALALILSIIIPLSAQAQTVVETRDIYHYHLGDGSSLDGCYTITNYHSHEGSSAAGGGCYSVANKHSHTGNSSAGGGCYTIANKHSHTGSASSGGGCYTVAIKHSHTGSASSGGGCYGTPVMHQHTGSAQSGGGCYTSAVYHQHSGSTSQVGGCYVTHVHTDSCYKWVHDCSISCDKASVYVEGPEHNCGRHFHQHGPDSIDWFTDCWECCGHSQYPDAHYEEECQGLPLNKKVLNCSKVADGPACGKNTQTVVSYNLGCGKTTSTIERYDLNCGKSQGQTTGYNLGCGLTNGQTTSYSLGCKLNDGQIVSYSLGCGMTPETIIGYSTGCGMDPDTPIGSFSIVKSTDDWAPSIELSIDTSPQELIESLGSFTINEDPFEGNYTIDESGTYTITFDVIPGYTCDPITIDISNVDVTAPILTDYTLSPTEWTKDDVVITLGDITDLQPDGSVGCDLDEFPISYDNGETWTDEYEHIYLENGIYEIMIRDAVGNISTTEVEISNIDTTPPTIISTDYDTTPDVKEITITVLAEDISPDGTAGCGLHDKPYSFDGGKTWTDQNTFTTAENGIVSIKVRDALENTAEKEVKVSNIKLPDPPKEPEAEKTTVDESNKEQADGNTNSTISDDNKNDTSSSKDNDSVSKGSDANDSDNSDSSSGNSADSNSEADDSNNSLALKPTKNTDVNKSVIDLTKLKPSKLIKKIRSTNENTDTIENEDSSENIPDDSMLDFEPKTEVDYEETTIENRQSNSDTELTVETLPNEDNSNFSLERFLLLFIITSLVCLLLLLLFFLSSRIVIISNLVHKDIYHFKGIALIRDKTEAYEINITNSIVDRCDTGKLRLKFSHLFILTHKDTDINVYLPDKQAYIVKPSRETYVYIRQ